MHDSPPKEPHWLATYCADIGGWGWAMYVGFFLSAAGLVADLAGWQQPIPSQILLLAMVLTALLAPIAAYRRMHQRLVRTNNERDSAFGARDSSNTASQLSEGNWQRRFKELEEKNKERLEEAGRQIFALKAEVSNLKATLDTRQANQVFRSMLAGFLVRGSQIVTKLSESQSDSQSLDKEITDWVIGIVNYLSALPDKSFYGRLRATNLTIQKSAIPSTVPEDRREMCASVLIKLAALKEFVAEIKA